MDQLRTCNLLEPLLENILSAIRNQVDERIQYKRVHPDDPSVQVKELGCEKETYDVYMAVTETMVYHKPDNGLLSDDLLNNADYEMDDNAHQFFVFEEEEEDSEEDDEDSQNRSETWEYGSDFEENDYGYYGSEEEDGSEYDEDYYY